MKKIALLLLILLYYAEAGNISGYVADLATGETLIGVNVMVEGTALGAASDRNGFFLISDIPTGTCNLRFSHIAFEELSMPVTVDADGEFLGTVSLAQKTVEMESITVTGKRGEIVKRDMDISSFEVDPVVLREVPSLGRDVFKLVQQSPSVTTSDPISPLYYVRGSDPGENLVMLDGMTIYNPQHMLSMQAIFNPYAIKNIEMLVGGFDAEFGGRNSSILYISTREGHKDEVKGEFKPSISGFNGAVEFPAFLNGTAMLSGRFMHSMVNRILMNMPNYLADFNGSWQTEVKSTKLRFSAFFARDYMDYDFNRFSIYFPQQYMKDYSFGFLSDAINSAAGLQTRTIITPSLIGESHIYFSRFAVNNTNFFSFSFTDTATGVPVEMKYNTRIINRISDLTVKGNLTYFAPLRQTIKLGLVQTSYNFYNDAGLYTNELSVTDRNANLASVFFQDKISVGSLLLKAGYRFSRFTGSDRWWDEPRVSLALLIGNSTLKAAWGRYYQFITTMNTQDFEISQYLDYYYPLHDVKPLVSIHHILSLEGQLSQRLRYSISAYYKDLETQYRFDYNTSSSSILAYNANLEKGTGEAYGLELVLRGDWKRFSGWASYSWSHSSRSYPSIQNGKAYIYDGDQPHNLKAVVLYKMTSEITTSSTLTISSGYPRTWESGYVNCYSYDPVENSYGIFGMPYTPVKNNVRYPTRMVWDMGWKKKLRSGFGFYLAEYIGSDEVYFTMSIQNLLFLRRNPYMYIFIPEYGYYGYGLYYFPTVSVGYSIKF